MQAGLLEQATAFQLGSYENLARRAVKNCEEATARK